jgi:two-component system KDP operon response regulator KdpE
MAAARAGGLLWHDDNQAGPMKVLIIDDHAPTRALISTWIRSLATEVREISNGRDGLSVCATFKPDIVTLDLRMRLMDGFDTLQALRAQYPDLHVVIVTQADFPDLRRKAAELGAAFFIPKDELRMLRWYLERELQRRSASVG